MTALKVTPLVFAWWLLTQRRWRGVQAFALAGVAVLAIGLAGAGIDNHFRFLEIAAETSATGSTPGSLAGLGRLAGLAPELARYLPAAALVAGLTLMFIFRSRPGVTFAIATVLLVVGSPSVAFHTPALLLTALVPAAWPFRAAAPAWNPAAPSDHAPQTPEGVLTT